MQVKVKLFATLREGRGKEVLFDVHERTSPKHLLDRLEIKQEDVAILLINGRDGEFDSELIHNDVLSVFPPVGGG